MLTGQDSPGNLEARQPVAWTHICEDDERWYQHDTVANIEESREAEYSQHIGRAVKKVLCLLVEFIPVQTEVLLHPTHVSVVDIRLIHDSGTDEQML
jgi:hypothetical protein